jgi:hypothetical protein
MLITTIKPITVRDDHDQDDHDQNDPMGEGR